MSEETKILKPQAPLMRGSDYVLPLTSADQVMLANGTRLEKDGKIVADYVSGISGEFLTLPVLAANWIQQEDGRWTNAVEVAGVTTDTRARYADIDLSSVTSETFADLEKAWLSISIVETVENGIQLTSFSKAPAVDFSMNVEVLI